MGNQKTTVSIEIAYAFEILREIMQKSQWEALKDYFFSFSDKKPSEVMDCDDPNNILKKYQMLFGDNDIFTTIENIMSNLDLYKK